MHNTLLVFLPISAVIMFYIFFNALFVSCDMRHISVDYHCYCHSFTPMFIIDWRWKRHPVGKSYCSNSLCILLGDLCGLLPNPDKLGE